ncbi:MAG: HEPN domain-containing protein [Planctomycetes bacterium]|nr:HEPN domain-containing protein [Planctomycetota bacterium]
MPPELAEVKRWLEKAKHDWHTAEAAVSHQPPITDTAAFHCQQAVEKLLKAYLVYRRNPFEKIHDLEELVNQCTTHDSKFAELRQRVQPLTTFAVRFRYPGPGDPSVEEVQAALKVVNEVQQFVTERLPTEVRQ